MIGIVLSGGKSTRMGADKGLIQRDGLHWAQLAFDKLKSFLPAVYISVSPAQTALYAKSFDTTYLLEDNPSLPIGGPVLGLLSAHLKHPGENIVVLACDMVEMTTAPIQFLLDEYKKMPGKEAYLFKNNNGLQPLVAIYTATLLEKLLLQLNEKQLTNFSVKHLIDISDSCLQTVPANWEQQFVNYNTHQDINNR